MKKITLLFTLFACTLGFAQNSESGSATVNATIISPIGISADTALDFGTFTTSATESTVKVAAADGARTFGNDDMEMASYTTASAASFTVDLETGETYGIALVVEAQPKHADESELTLSALEHSLDSDSGNNATSFDVGGTLTVPADASAGSYSGKVKVTVTYE